MLDLHKLKYFISIVDNNFVLSNASKELNITQPSLSLTINYLEDHFQTPLLVKNKNKFVDLTPEGRILYDDAKKLIEDSNRTFMKMTDLDKYTGKITVGIPPVTQPIVCPKVIAMFKKKYPKIEILICEEGAYIAKTRLLAGDLDFGFLTVFQNDDRIDDFPIFESDVVAMFKEGHPLSAKDYVSTKDVAQYDIIGLDQTFTLYQMIDVYFNNEGTKIDYFHLTSRWDFALEMVRNNDNNFITILPNPLLNIYYNTNIIHRKFKSEFKWSVNLSYKKDRLLRPECILFMDFVKDFFNIKQ